MGISLGLHAHSVRQLRERLLNQFFVQGVGSNGQFHDRRIYPAVFIYIVYLGESHISERK
jgi:hypothetical protein